MTATEINVLREATARLEEAFLSADPARVADLFSEDAVLIPPHRPIVIGRSGLVAYYKSFFAALAVRLEIMPEEMETLTDAAYIWGLFRMEASVRATGENIHGKGKFFLLLKPAPDGQWRVFRHMWSYPPDVMHRLTDAVGY
ncbi:MAG: nuclear transport factor 2 family protein [Bryobacteraceae bacterium]|nr:nuclear transport factor 2 family protein [Bryobacteraceae bacterium]